jgi:heme oxygenase
MRFALLLVSTVQPSGTMLAQLDRETARFHADAERCWRSLAESDRATRQDYAKQLCLTHGFEAPFEAACAYTPGLSQVIDLRGRARAGLLAQDLLTLGATPSQITAMHTRSIEPFQDPAEALAWMYVVERPTLRFEAVRQQLTSRFTDLTRAMTYLSAYEGQTRRRWADLGSAFDRICTSDTVRERIADAATDAFNTLLEWQRSHGPALRMVG